MLWKNVSNSIQFGVMVHTCRTVFPSGVMSVGAALPWQNSWYSYWKVRSNVLTDDQGLRTSKMHCSKLTSLNAGESEGTTAWKLSWGLIDKPPAPVVMDIAIFSADPNNRLRISNFACRVFFCAKGYRGQEGSWRIYVIWRKFSFQIE